LVSELTFLRRTGTMAAPHADPTQGDEAPMSVANGRELLNIPGPTNIPDAVLAAMHRPAIDIYSGEMLAITRSLHEDLPKVFRTAGPAYIYAAVASAPGA
jgi:aspartate aminotransferase-like enzyme